MEFENALHISHKIRCVIYLETESHRAQTGIFIHIFTIKLQDFRLILIYLTITDKINIDQNLQRKTN
jgi:hypothetical protein